MKAVIAALALSVVAMVGSAEAQSRNGRWTPSSVNDAFIRGVDETSIRATGSVREFWSVTVYAERSDFVGHQVDYMLVNYKIDCVALTVATISLHGYLGDGSSVFSSKLSGTPQPIVPESMSEGEMVTVCDEPSSSISYPTVEGFYRWSRASGIASWNG